MGIKKHNKMKLIILITTVVLFSVIISTTSVYAYKLHNYNNLMSSGKNALDVDKFSNAIDYYNKAAQTYFGKKHINEVKSAIGLVNKIKASKQNYDKAQKLIIDKKYLEAVDLYMKVIKEDGKRYSDSKRKAGNSGKLFIAENIKDARNEATNKNYTTAINYLNAILNFQQNNDEAIQLKNEYSALKQKEDDEKKLEEEKKLEKEKNKIAVNNEAVQTIAKKATVQVNTQNNNNSIQNNTTQQNKQPEETVTASNGWFHVDKHDGIMTPNGFGVKSIYYDSMLNSIYFQVINGSDQPGQFNFSMTFHLQGGDVTYTGTTSDNTLSENVNSNQAPSGSNIKIDISIIYKGKTYSDSFSKVINN